MEGQENPDSLFDVRNNITGAVSNTEALLADYKDKPEVIETRLGIILSQLRNAMNSLDQIQ